MPDTFNVSVQLKLDNGKQCTIIHEATRDHPMVAEMLPLLENWAESYRDWKPGDPE